MAGNVRDSGLGHCGMSDHNLLLDRHRRRFVRTHLIHANSCTKLHDGLESGDDGERDDSKHTVSLC